MSGTAGSGRERSGAPVPFTSEWITSPPPPRRPRRFELSHGWLPAAVPSWLPSERALSALVVLALVLAAAVSAGRGGSSGQTLASNGAASEPPSSNGVQLPASVGGTDSSSDDGEPSSAPNRAAAAAAPTAVVTATVNLDEPRVVASADGSLLPNFRILTYYGHPHDTNMGILGQYGVEQDLDGLHEKLEEQAEEYRKADPSRPILLAFEVIASVAQGQPQNDGSWLLNTDAQTIQEYIDYAAEHDMLVFLDVQIGLRGVPEEIDLVRSYLEHPNVHLALDPEFAIGADQIPGEHVGSITAEDVRYAQNYLIELTASLGIPPKVLIVHQFLPMMIQNKEQITAVPGVQLVIVMDGHGPPNTKLETYGAVIASSPIEYNGVKLFYDQDAPLLTAREVVALDPVPDLIIYQ